MLGGKDDVSSFEVVYGQVLNHDMSCSKAEARECWTLPQFLKVTTNAEFAEYAANNNILDNKSTDAAKKDESLGYFSDEELQEDEKEEVTDDDFFKLLNQNILEEDTARKQPTEEENHNAHQLPFTAGHWQGNEAQDCHDDGEYYQTFEVDEEHNNTSATPEKKHLKSDEVEESPDVIHLSHFLTYPHTPDKVDDVEDDVPTDVWDASWVRDATLDERKKILPYRKV